MISPADMILFATVVREGSFTGAARRIGITKQAASERIAKLESQLGVRLLERTTRKLRVTGAGATYYERCAAISAQVEEANREVQEGGDEPIGLLRIGSPPLYGRRYLAPVVNRFLTTHPGVQLELVLADRRIDLVEDGLDLAIHIGTLDDSSRVARRLGEAATYLVASPGYLAQHGAPRARDLRAARCIGFSPIEIWDVEGVKSRMEPVLVVNDLEVACEAALAGVGIARVPELLCREAVRDGRLRILFGPKPAMLRPIHAVYSSRQNLPVKVRRFVDALASHIPPPRRRA
jgi:DNA-binding transcriptional LysR family regulator